MCINLVDLWFINGLKIEPNTKLFKKTSMLLDFELVIDVTTSSLRIVEPILGDFSAVDNFYSMLILDKWWNKIPMLLG